MKLSILFVNGRQGRGGGLGSYYLMNGCITNLPLWIKLLQKHWQGKSTREKPLGVALEVYEATPVFSPVDITEDVVETVA